MVKKAYFEDLEEEEVFQVVRKRLSGAQRRKLRAQQQLVVQPKSYAQAVKSVRACSLGEKGLSLESVRKKNVKEQVRKSECSSQRVIKVAVVPKGYPDVCVTEEQSNQFQEALIDKICFSDNKEPVQILLAIWADGAVIFTCANAWTATWLEETAPELKPWAGARLKAGSVSTVLRRAKVMVWIPKLSRGAPKKTWEIMDLIQNGNVSVSVTNWKLVSRKDLEGGSSLVFYIDERSFRTLKSLNFRLNFSTSQITFKPLSKPPGHN